MPSADTLSLVAVSGGMPRGAVGAALAMVLTAGTVLWLALLWRSIRGTTLVGPWCWALAAVCAVGFIETLFQLAPLGGESLWLSAGRFAAGALSLCPTVAVLGAKRPQDRAWNFVVLTLWALVSLPSLLALLLGRASEFQLADLRGIAIWGLIALPAINYFPTRFVWPALLVVVGQVIHFTPHLPLLGRDLLTTDPGLVTLTCFAAAALLAWQAAREALSREPSTPALWLSFRDALGLFWGLRVQERVNAAARQYGWPFYLSWRGFRSLADHAPLAEIPAAHQQALLSVLRGLVRRFATGQWIAARLPRGID